MILNKRHTGLVVRNLERSIQFYESLGLSLWQREVESGQFIDTVVGIPNVCIEWAKMKCLDGSVVELLQYHSHQEYLPVINSASNRLGCSHVAFTVNDIDSMCAKVIKLGGSVVNLPAVAPNNRVMVAYCHDLDGILIEIVQELFSCKPGKGHMDNIAEKQSMICPVCGNMEYRIAYEGYIRDGIFGSKTNVPVKVLECIVCGLQRLENFFLGVSEYSANDYREKYFNTSEVDKLLALDHPEQAERIKLIANDRHRDKVILDYGCGDGYFLDSVIGFMKKTYAIEPCRNMWDSLQSRGHHVFASGTDALRALRGKFDIVTCFGVIEHTEKPLEIVKDCFELLSSGGVLYLQTDNLHDILMSTGAKGFSEFFYRTAHNWYFSAECIKKLVSSAGFKDVTVSTLHAYDFSNFLRWHRDGIPTGNAKTALLGSLFDRIWQALISDKGCGDLITVIARKN